MKLEDEDLVGMYTMQSSDISTIGMIMGGLDLVLLHDIMDTYAWRDVVFGELWLGLHEITWL